MSTRQDQRDARRHPPENEEGGRTRAERDRDAIRDGRGFKAASAPAEPAFRGILTLLGLNAR